MKSTTKIELGLCLVELSIIPFISCTVVPESLGTLCKALLIFHYFSVTLFLKKLFYKTKLGVCMLMFTAYCLKLDGLFVIFYWEDHLVDLLIVFIWVCKSLGTLKIKGNFTSHTSFLT